MTVSTKSLLRLTSKHVEDVAVGEKSRLHIYVSGRVQGIGYRSYVKRRAQDLGVNGWVKNLSDGRVEVLAEGDADKVEQLLEICSRGPPLAKVSNVEVRREQPKSDLMAFAVLL
ncbi:MAG: acylphosphatase [Thaumarchaeota archaeon]|nr:acylphosphatase [Nitrososphaerota archaeon]